MTILFLVGGFFSGVLALALFTNVFARKVSMKIRIFSGILGTILFLISIAVFYWGICHIT